MVDEFTAGVVGLGVFDRDGQRIGNVRDVSLDRTCILVEPSRHGLRRKHVQAVHLCAVRAIDVDRGTISLATSSADVADAPEFHELDPDSEAAIARFYFTRLQQA
jgi:hypothetical protein